MKKGNLARSVITVEVFRWLMKFVILRRIHAHPCWWGLGEVSANKKEIGWAANLPWQLVSLINKLPANQQTRDLLRPHIFCLRHLYPLTEACWSHRALGAILLEQTSRCKRARTRTRACTCTYTNPHALGTAKQGAEWWTRGRLMTEVEWRSEIHMICVAVF